MRISHMSPSPNNKVLTSLLTSTSPATHIYIQAKYSNIGNKKNIRKSSPNQHLEGLPATMFTPRQRGQAALGT